MLVCSPNIVEVGKKLLGSETYNQHALWEGNAFIFKKGTLYWLRLLSLELIEDNTHASAEGPALPEHYPLGVNQAMWHVIVFKGSGIYGTER